MVRTIEMLIPLKGIAQGKSQLSIKTTGFVGTTCQEATRNLQAALGQTTADEATSELYETEEQREHLDLGGSGG